MLNLVPQILDRLDQSWFTDHPGRTFRIRRMLPGEAELFGLPALPAGAMWWAVVADLPNALVRAAVVTAIDAALPDHDAFGQAVVQLLTIAGPEQTVRIADIVPLAELAVAPAAGRC